MEESNRSVCIILCVHPKVAEAEVVLEMTYGIEEEGIPHRLVVSEAVGAKALAEEAVRLSQLGVGIGIDEEGLAVLYQEKLPEGHFLFQEQLPRTRRPLRDLGSDAARLVKGIPFKM